jgi:putative IMPACT (imprinted ancient) family translation regulator
MLMDEDRQAPVLDPNFDDSRFVNSAHTTKSEEEDNSSLEYLGRQDSSESIHFYHSSKTIEVQLYTTLDDEEHPSGCSKYMYIEIIDGGKDLPDKLFLERQLK